MTRPAKISTSQMRRLHGLLRDHGISGDKTTHDYINAALSEHGHDPVESRTDLTSAAAAQIIADLEVAEHVRTGAHDATDALTAALVAVQAEMPTVAKTKSATIPGRDGKAGFTYSYAGLADVSAAIMPLLTKHGLAFTCAGRGGDRGYELVARLLHVSGQSIEGSLPLHGNDPRSLGSAITYARRYLLGTLTGVVTDDDVDGDGTQGAARTQAWDGPSTPDLLNRIDAAAAKAGVTYEQATAKFRQARGGMEVGDLDSLDPWLLTDLTAAVEKRAQEVVKAREAEESAPGEGGEVPRTDSDTADPSAPDDPWAAPAGAQS